MSQQEQPPLKAVSGLDTSVHGARARIPYDDWAESTRLPIYGGHVIRDPLRVNLAHWPLLGMDTAFVQLEGMPTVCEGRISELAAGASSTPLRQAVSEIVYVLAGQGVIRLWSVDGAEQVTEWHTASLFVLPRNVTFEFRNDGDQPARFLSYNYRPLAMTSLPDVDLHFNGPWEEPGLLNGSGRPFYASPAVETTGSWNGHGDDRITWRGNFFDDVRAWDELLPDKERGVSTKLARIEFPGAEMSCHMSAIGPQTYDKAVKHGPGRIVILVKGDGMGAVTTPRGWENSELYHSEVKAGVLKQGDSAQVRIVSPLDEGSLFAVPDDWYHQHFNTSRDETRFLVLHPLPQFAGSPYRYQMEYADEDPWVRGAFESALAGKGLESLMPEEAYADGGGQSTGEAGG